MILRIAFHFANFLMILILYIILILDLLRLFFKTKDGYAYYLGAYVALIAENEILSLYLNEKIKVR